MEKYADSRKKNMTYYIKYQKQVFSSLGNSERLSPHRFLESYMGSRIQLYSRRLHGSKESCRGRGGRGHMEMITKDAEPRMVMAGHPTLVGGLDLDFSEQGEPGHPWGTLSFFKRHKHQTLLNNQLSGVPGWFIRLSI